jgi:hypothetical protein
MRKGLIASLAVSLVILFAVPAGADPPLVESFERFSFSCDLSGENGDGFVFVESEDFGEGLFSFADAFIWLPGSTPFEEEPDLFSDFEGVEVIIEGDQVAATIPMIFAETGEPDGTLTLEGTVGALLGEETFSERFREGNRWVEFTETIQFFEASAVVTLDGAPFETSCTAERSQVESRSTNPHAMRIDFEDAFVECFGIEGTDGSTLNLFAGEFENDAFIDLEIFGPNGENGEHEENGESVPAFFGSAEIAGLSGTINVDVPLFDPFDGEEPVAVADVTMTVDEGETITSNIVFQDGMVKEMETELLISGSVVLDVDGRTYDLDGCFGSRFEARGLVNEAAGPQEKGRTPVNDAPEGAVALDIGKRANQQTKAASPEPEEQCSIEFDFEDEHEENGESFDLPLGKTVWYSVEGDGGPVTVSTSGSNFDTILGVYVADGETIQQVDCVDDVFGEGVSLQAEVTWDTAPGQTYLIQAGGFGFFADPEFPEEESGAEYGLLKISVSG